jgi:hypothetical protein
MRKVLLSPLPLVLWLGVAGGLRAQDDPRAVVARAVAALGGEEALGRNAALAVKVKGTLAGVDEGVTFTGELFAEPRGRVKLALHVRMSGVHVSLTEVLDGAGGWASADGRVEDLKPEMLASLRRAVYIDRVLTLTPLLKDPAYTLTPLGETTVDGRPALGVKVASAGHPDLELYFDKASGLLVKSAHRAADALSKKEVLEETVYGDYREPDLGAADEEVLKAAGLHTTGPEVLDFLRRQTPPAVDPAKVRALIRQLGDESFAARRQASADLVDLGAGAAPWLQEALNDDDPEVAHRARECLDRIGAPADASLVAAAVRLAGLRRPEGAAEALLALVARTRDEALGREARAALAALAAREGKPDPALLRALDDSDPVRQAAAAAALGRDGGAYARLPGRRLYLTGLKLPMKVVTYADGKKLTERETVRVEYFNEFDDSLFARPRESTPRAPALLPVAPPGPGGP